jgi:Leucine-rich repeat (LRR) protein
MTGPLYIKEQYPEGTKFEEINGFSELIIKAQLIKKSDEYRELIQGKILIINLGYRERTDFSKMQTGDSVEDLIIKAIVPQVDGQAKKLVKVPDELKEFLPMASYINLSDNDISELPDWMSRNKLKGIYLANNQLSEFPKWIKRCTQLEELDISQNEIRNISAIEFLKRNNLIKYINLSSNELTSIDFFAFNLRNLEKIDLSNNKIEDCMSPDYFRGNKKLKSINLNYWGPEINDLDFRHTPQLERLSLEGHQIGSWLEEGLGDNIADGMEKIKTENPDEFGEDYVDDGSFILAYDYLQDRGIYELKNLKYLNLSSNGLNVLPNKIFNLQNLKTLVLEENNFSDEQISFIKQKFPDIEHIFFD